MNSDYKGMRAGFATVTTLFFMWGFITVSIDPLIAALKAIFELTYAEAMLTQFAFFMAYFVVSLPAAALIARLGNSKSIIFALGVMVVGCLIVPAATYFDTYCAGAGRAVRHRERHHHPAGGRESAGRGARPAGALALPPDVLADIQFVRHLARADLVVRHHPRGRHLRGHARRGGHARAARRIVPPHRRVFLAIAGALVLLALFIFVFRKLLDVTKPVDEGQRPSIATAFKSPLGRVRRVRDLPVRRRRGFDRQCHDELPGRARHAEHPARGGRQDGELLLGWRDGRSLHRQRLCCSS